MTAISHFLAPGGWKIDFKDPSNLGCTKLLPDTGTTLLIGRSKTDNVCNVVWMDRSKALRTLNNLVCKGPYWEAVIQSGKQYYVVTVWKGKTQKGRARISGDIELGRKSKLAAKAEAWRPGTDFEAQGTWGAEVNPGG